MEHIRAVVHPLVLCAVPFDWGNKKKFVTRRMIVLKSRTQTATNAANALTITSPNIKTIFLKAYLACSYGSGAGDTDITVQITDENKTVLWQDAMPANGATLLTSAPRCSFVFPGLGLPVPPGKNLTVTVLATAANETTELNILYNI